MSYHKNNPYSKKGAPNSGKLRRPARLKGKVHKKGITKVKKPSQR